MARSSTTDFFAAITLEATLDCHDVIGGTARQRVKEALASAAATLLATCGHCAGRGGMFMLVRKARLQDASNIFELVN